jgi:hypothetical protein
LSVRCSSSTLAKRRIWNAAAVAGSAGAPEPARSHEVTRGRVLHCGVTDQRRGPRRLPALFTAPAGPWSTSARVRMSAAWSRLRLRQYLYLRQQLCQNLYNAPQKSIVSSRKATGHSRPARPQGQVRRLRSAASAPPSSRASCSRVCSIAERWASPGTRPRRRSATPPRRKASKPKSRRARSACVGSAARRETSDKDSQPRA